MNLTLISHTPEFAQVACSGQVTQITLHSGGDPLEELLSPRAWGESILLDLSQAQFIDSSGVGWMLKCHKRCKQAGGRIVFHSAPPLVSQTLELLQMGRVLALAKDAKSARALVADQLQVQVDSSSNGLHRLRISGALTAPHLQQGSSNPLEQILGTEGYTGRLLVNLAKLSALDSVGITWLAATHARSVETGGEVVFYGLPESMRAEVASSPAGGGLMIAENEAAAALQLKGR